ncbi:MAG: DEAD/DEAH box helicase, partial [Pseudomonadota bacterium]
MKEIRTQYRNPRRPFRRTRPSGIKKETFENPRLDPQLKHLFQKIGIPEPAPFKPDPFQVEALEKLEKADVLVSAPTGAGKTWIAVEAISKAISRGQTVWYASPLKALSNSIYLEFIKTFGTEKCGILTGDRKENPSAPIIVGTTEILRNQLYDAMHQGADIQADLVVLDEAHYLGDPDRGVVWEEVLIYLPPRVTLLLLSATISNAEELCAWFSENRGTPARVVRAYERPVPLEMLFLFPDGFISPLSGKKGLVGRVSRFVADKKKRGPGRGSGKMNYGDIIKCLKAFDLLPAIFFLKSRSDCDSAVQSCISNRKAYEDREKLEKEVRAFIKRYPHLTSHRLIRPLVEFGVGSHHAGQLPYWKALIERVMNRGCLDAIFSTSTVAAGVNFPARTVVLVQSDRYDGREFNDLTATDFHQMVGRAGRRGKDNIGFAMVIPGRHQDPQLIYELKDSPPEPVMSQIRINFSMTLNLLLSHRPAEVKNLLERSFAAFQEKGAGVKFRERWDEKLEALGKAIPAGKCDTGDPYEVMENIQKRSALMKKRIRLSKKERIEEIMRAYEVHLKPGTLFVHKNQGVYLLSNTHRIQGRLICEAFDIKNIKKPLRSKKRRFRPRKFDFGQIKAIYDYRVPLTEDFSPEALGTLLREVSLDEVGFLEIESPEKAGQRADGGETGEKFGTMVCDDCKEAGVCHDRKSGELQKILKEIRQLGAQMEGMGGGLWVSFKKHLRFLKETGFVDEEDRLTPDGLWASKLRLDHPLLIAEAIRKGAFEEVTPEIMACCMAPFVWDRVQDLDIKIESPVSLLDCEKAF